MIEVLEDIKIILLDADNTIIDHKKCERQALLNVFNGIKEEYKEEYQDIFRPLDRTLWDNAAKNQSIVTKEEIPNYRFKVFFQKIQIDYNNYEKANQLFQEGLVNACDLEEGVEKNIKYLYHKGYDLYVITNGLVKLQKPRIVNSRIGKYISDIIVSEEVGVSKPNPEIFNVLLEKINRKPKEAVMIGDSLEKDMKGAKNAQIQTIWYNPVNQMNTSDIYPDFQIRNWDEIQDIL